MAVSNMLVPKPLVATGNGPQLFRASASADWHSNQVTIHIYSVTIDGKKTTEHASCKVEYADKDAWLKDFKRNAYLIQSRIDSLKRSVDVGQSHKIKRGMAYKLFGALVEYGPGYRGMQEVILDSAQLEATSRVEFQTTEEDGEFYFSPYWIDSLGHLTGFVMNANDGIDSKSTVFVNHGWESMRCPTRFSREKTYRSYVRMQNVSEAMFAGDVYIFDEDTVVAIYQGVKVGPIWLPDHNNTNAYPRQFQGIPRRVLDHLFPTGKLSKPAPNPKMDTTPQVITGKVFGQSAKAPQTMVPQGDSVRAVSSGPSIAVRALEIVAEEIGLAASELEPSNDFADLGVDSLLSLTISSRLREELELDVPSSLFAEYPTVKELTMFLGGIEESAPSTQTSTNCPTPKMESETGGYETDQTAMSSTDLDNSNVMASIRCVLAEEIGVSADELKGSSDLGEFGLDSLLSLTVLARLREELELELSPSLLAENNSLNEIEAALGLKQALIVTIKEILPIADIHVPTSTARVSSVPAASSMMLQGNPKVATKFLFLFPDGSGSATSYAPLPTISSDVVVYGLNCPYMRSPQNMKCSLEELTPPYLAEVRRRQPHGPYYLGGWSAGGICAFDAAQELERCGETVARLILIDSPFPVGLEKLPPRLYDFFTSINLFGSGAAPKWLIPHFLAFVDSLDKYRVRPFAPGHGPKTHIVWAKDGVCKNPGDPRPEPRADDPREMNWLLNNRTDFGPNGWDTLLGAGDVVVETLEDANHFTLMEGKKAVELARFIERATT